MDVKQYLLTYLLPFQHSLPQHLFFVSFLHLLFKDSLLPVYPVYQRCSASIREDRLKCLHKRFADTPMSMSKEIVDELIVSALDRISDRVIVIKWRY